MKFERITFLKSMKLKRIIINMDLVWVITDFFNVFFIRVIEDYIYLN